MNTGTENNEHIPAKLPKRIGFSRFPYYVISCSSGGFCYIFALRASSKSQITAYRVAVSQPGIVTPLAIGANTFGVRVAMNHLITKEIGQTVNIGV
jgi:hypothetical protein